MSDTPSIKSKTDSNLKTLSGASAAVALVFIGLAFATGSTIFSIVGFVVAAVFVTSSVIQLTRTTRSR